MSIEDMNRNIAIRQMQRQQYQQKYFATPRQLDMIQLQIKQLQEQLIKAEQMKDQPLVNKIREKLKGLVDKWNNIKGQMKGR